MPTYDGGHYFLTAIVPISTVEIKDGHTVTSPVHALRKQLDILAPAAQSPATRNGQSPFAKSKRTHFARFVIIDDVAYPGRVSGNTLETAARNYIRPRSPTVAQAQDHLSCPFLLFAVDFDAASGSDSERDSYLVGLWDVMGSELANIFQFCHGFDAKNGKDFAAYVAKCQLETTMSFNDYYAVIPDLPAWPDKMAWAAILLSIVIWGGLWWGGILSGFWLPVAGVVALVLAIVAAYLTVMAAGRKPFPAAPDSNLPTVLKALYLQRVFTRFVIDNQVLAADPDEAAARRLYDEFKTFVAANKLDDLEGPTTTQSPGVIGF